MPQINVRVLVDGEPLRRARVQRLTFGVPNGEYMTDDDGYVRTESGDQGIDSATPWVDVRVNCQNSVVMVRNGSIPGYPLPVWFDMDHIQDNAVIEIANLGPITEGIRDHFRILNSCLEVYDAIYRPFPPFAEMSDPEFPLGKGSDLFDTFTQSSRIEVSYPDNFPGAQLSFVEPAGLETDYPLIHFRNDDPRLFGDGVPATLIPAEMAHALHFSLLSASRRALIQNDYVSFIITDFLNGGGGTHMIDKETTPMVAFLEALDHFSHRFSYFVRSVRAGKIRSNAVRVRAEIANSGVLLTELTSISERLADLESSRESGSSAREDERPPRRDRVSRLGLARFPTVYPEAPGPDAETDQIIDGFIQHELSPHVTFGQQVGASVWDGSVQPNYDVLPVLDSNGTSVEGAVYGALYLDLAGRIGLETVLETVFESEKLTFGAYRDWIDENRSQYSDDLDEVASVWQM